MGLHLGEGNPRYEHASDEGASSRHFVDSNDLMALKVMEVGGETKTKIHVFDLNGNFLMEPFMLVDEAKYEGLEIFAN